MTNTKVKISPHHLLSIIEDKEAKNKVLKDQEIEDYIQQNISEGKTFFYIFRKGKVSRNDVIKSINQDYIDDKGYNLGPLKDLITKNVGEQEPLIKELRDLANRAKKNDEKYIEINLDDLNIIEG